MVKILAETVLTCRHVYKKSSSVWQGVYHNIIEKVQDMMLVVYGAKLKLQDTFTWTSLWQMLPSQPVLWISCFQKCLQKPIQSFVCCKDYWMSGCCPSPNILHRTMHFGNWQMYSETYHPLCKKWEQSICYVVEKCIYLHWTKIRSF